MLFQTPGSILLCPCCLEQVKIILALFFAVRELRLQSLRLWFSRSENITQTEGDLTLRHDETKKFKDLQNARE